MLFHKAFKLVTNLAFMAAFVLIISSCGKEQLDQQLVPVTPVESTKGLEDYPKEITLENLNEFVHAPQAVVDHFAALEATKRRQSKAISAEEFYTESDRSALVFGYVQAYNGAWNPIEGVDISTNNCGSTSVNFSPNNYFFSSTCIGPLCMNYTTFSTNGVSTFDIVQIIRHTLNITPFTEARQFLAADVNRDGLINTLDTDIMRNVILGILPGFPTDNVVFVIEQDYLDVQTEIDNTGTVNQFFLQSVGLIGNCLNQALVNRRAIKTGDVSGNFSF